MNAAEGHHFHFHLLEYPGTPAAFLAEINEKLGRIMAALQDLQAADTALKNAVTQFLTDIAGRLSGDSVSAADVEAVVGDINEEVAALQAADPANAAPAAPVEAAPDAEPAQ